MMGGGGAGWRERLQRKNFLKMCNSIETGLPPGSRSIIGGAKAPLSTIVYDFHI